MPMTLQEFAQEAYSEIEYNNSTYDIVSKVAYLIGVPVQIFENPHEPPQMEVYNELEKNKPARIIRNLCLVRANIEKHYGKISKQMKTQFKSIYTLPEYVPKDALNKLSQDGISLTKKSGTHLNNYIIEINRLIRDRINNCNDIFPLWLNWEYIKDLINMENGLSETGIKAAADLYFANQDCYPYQVYINWFPQPCGNILYSDKKFVSLLYQWHDDKFTEFSNVSDASDYVKDSIYSFIDDAKKLVMVVDCENSDPYRLWATLNGLDKQCAAKISKIVLVDDVHTVNAWRIMESHTTIPVEHIMTERVKKDKSLVDIELTAMTCKEHYKNNVDSFIIVSSDSDYWGLIASLAEAKFLVMIERGACSPDMKAAMSNSGIFYCHIDDFYTGDGNDLKMKALFTELYSTLDSAIHLNIYDMLETALLNTRIDMDDAAKRQFINKHIRQMSLAISETGDVSLELKH